MLLTIWVSLLAVACGQARTSSHCAGPRAASSVGPELAIATVEAAQSPARGHFCGLCGQLETEAAEAETDSEGKTAKDSKSGSGTGDDDDGREVDVGQSPLVADMAVAVRAWVDLMEPAYRDLQPETPPPRA